MLRHEDAAKMLEAERTTHWQKVCLQTIAGLPATLRPTAYALLGRDDAGMPAPSGSQEANGRGERIVSEGYERLAALPPDHRLTIFSALFPAAAPAFEAGWRLMARQSYQTGWQRKAFRLCDAAGTTPARRMWLGQLVHILGEYRDKDSTWLAAWAPYLGYGQAAQPLGVLCAAAIDAGGPAGEQVFETLVASARGEHPIGAMGRHVTTDLLAAARVQRGDARPRPGGERGASRRRRPRGHGLDGRHARRACARDMRPARPGQSGRQERPRPRQGRSWRLLDPPLGSAVVHRQPGGVLCIVPVHGQHRGRLFLPFSDNDPRTAEVGYKVVLLARDKEIKDPSILEQIL